MAYDTTEAVAKFLSGFQMKITNRERDTVAPDYYVKYLLTLSKGGKDFSTTFVSDPRAFGEPTVTQVFSALADDALTLRKYSTDEFVDKLYAQGVKPSAALRAYDSCKETKKSDKSDFVNPYGGNHILVSGSVGRWNGTSTGIAVYKDFDAATDCSPSRFGQGNVFADCEIQKVWDENGTLYLAGAHHDGRVSVEMRQLTDAGERLWGQLDYEDYLPLEGLTAMGKHYELGDENQFIHDLYNSPELCAAPRYVEQSFGCPSEEYEKEEGTLPHDFTTGKWRVHLIYPGERYGLDGCLTYELNAYSGVPAAAHRASYPLVEFYDTSQDAARFPGGQFVSRYYMTDLLEDNSIAVSIDTMLKNGNQFSLDGGIPAWTVEGDDLAKVNDFLKKSCMEFCGSLPGDEKGEDGYSLSGEAKEAALSHFALPENRKAALDVIRKLNESRDSNENAL